jgi:capsular polysaccharide biosynthesis protein
VAATLAAGLTAFFVARAEMPTYDAEVQVLVGPINGDFDTLEASRQLAVTYADLVTSRDLRAATALQLGLGKLPASDVSATANDLTRLLTIHARNESPVVAAAIANTLAQKLSRLSAANSKTQGNVQVVDRARPPTSPVAPRVGLLTALGAFAGLLLGLGLLVVRSFFDGVVRQQSELEHRPDLAFAGSIVDGAGRRGRGADQVAVLYRLAVRKVEAARGERPHIVVVSSGAGDPGTAVALGLAHAWQRTAGHVLLLDADDLDASLTQACGLDGRAGLAEVAWGTDAALEAAVVTQDGIEMLPRGAEPVQLTEKHTRALLDALGTRANVVIVKVGSPAEGEGPIAWLGAGDASIVVATRDRTKLSAVTEVAELMHLAGAQTVGAVLYVEGSARWRLASKTVSRASRAATAAVSAIPTRKPPSDGRGREAVARAWRAATAAVSAIPAHRPASDGRGRNDRDAPRKSVAQTRASEQITADRRRLQQLIDAGLVDVGSRIRGRSPHGDSWAIVHDGGKLELSGSVWAGPTEAATKVTGRRTDGLAFWQARRNDGFVSLARLVKLANALDDEPPTRRPRPTPAA